MFAADAPEDSRRIDPRAVPAAARCLILNFLSKDYGSI
jgi:hypothetical protein